MRIERRDFLKIGAAAVFGLYLLDRVVLTPAGKRWTAQSERIALLEAKVEKGRRLKEDEKFIRAKWAEMQQSDLPPDMSDAEGQVFASIQTWAAGTGLNINSLSPQWRTQDEDFDLYEIRATTTGTQAALGRFMYNLETDKQPVKLEECDLTARDNKGQQLTGALRFSYIRLKGSNAKP